jgi:hypothetical protein
MKKLIWGTLLAVLFNSCVTFKMYDRETAKMRLPEYDALVIKTNGEKISGNKISNVYDKKVFKEFVFKIDGNTIPESQVIAYQDKKAFFRKYNNQWAKSLRKGKINLFYFDTYVSSNSRDSRGYTDHYVFEKNNNGLKECSKSEISEMLIDNSEAYNKFNQEFKKTNGYIIRQMKLAEILSIIDIYNQ